MEQNTGNFADNIAENLDILVKKLKLDKLLSQQKPTVTIEEFIENLELYNVFHLMGQDLPDYYALFILHNLSKYEEHNRPLVCLDAKRKKFTYYSNDKWVENDFQHKTMKLIFSKMYKLVTQFVAEEIKKKHNEELQLCVCKIFDPDKYPYEKLIDKILVKLGNKLK
jgi:hypothetical protein